MANFGGEFLKLPGVGRPARGGGGMVGAGPDGAEPGPSRPPQRQQTPRWVAEASDLAHDAGTPTATPH